MPRDGFFLMSFVAANYKTQAKIMSKVKFGEGENGKNLGLCATLMDILVAGRKWDSIICP